MKKPLSRRRLAVGAAWAVPTVVTAVAAPALAASTECPTNSPLSTSGSMVVPQDVCAGGDWSGDFHFTLRNQTSETYSVTIDGLKVTRRQIYPTAGSPTTSTVDPSKYTIDPPLSGVVASMTTFNGSGIIPDFPNAGIERIFDANGAFVSANQVGYSVTYTVSGPDLPGSGCSYDQTLGISYHCE